MAHLLTEGAIMKLALGDECDEPVVQVLGHKVVESCDSRIRLLISDGKHCIAFVMLASQLCPMVINGELEMHSIIRIRRQKSTTIPGKKEKTSYRVVIILEMEILKRGSDIGQTIGTPIFVNDTGAPQIPDSAPIECSGDVASIES